MWLEDPLTGDTTHRIVVEEEDEQQAQELAPQYDAQPEVQVGAHHPDHGQAKCAMLLPTHYRSPRRGCSGLREPLM